MSRILPALLVMAALHPAVAAPPIVHGAMPPYHERPSTGQAITGSTIADRASDSMHVCMIRVEFLEDFTDETTGNGKMNLGADPPHDRDYFVGLSDEICNYFDDVSRDNLHLTLDVYPLAENSSYGLDHQMIYYGDDGSFMTGACLLLRDAVEVSDPEIDFSMYDAVIVIHAGAGQEADIYRDSPGDIGSVFLTLADLQYYLPGAGVYYTGIPTDDGVKVTEGSIVPEQESQDGFGLGVLGTICHEFGHQLGLPDLYDTMTGKVGVGGWDLMGYGQWLMSGYWPTAPGAWCMEYLGWRPVTEFSGNGEYSITQGDSILRIPLTSTEYLLVENRQRDPDGDGMCGVHEHDFGLAGSGILIWHVDETRLGIHITSNTVNVDPDHKGVDLEEADGIQDFDYSLPDVYGYEGSQFDPWFAGGYAWLFSPESEPSSEASWGGNTFVTVEVLDELSNTMRLHASQSNVCDGWPVSESSVQWGPLIWKESSGDRLVVTTVSDYVRAYGPEGSEPELMGINITAPPAAGSPSGGDELLLLCDGSGEVHLRDLEWNEPQGWPVHLEAGFRGECCLISSRLGLVAVADDAGRVYCFDAEGEVIPGWPVRASSSVTGLAVFPDSENPGIIAVSQEGRVHLWNLDGTPAQGWPVSPGDENTGIPVSADINRDGSPDVVVISGFKVFAYDGEGVLLAGFPSPLPSQPLSSPCLADPNSDGMLDIIVTVEEGFAAMGPSGATLSDWPVFLQQDSLVAGLSRNRRGIGGSGFVISSLDDGRICMMDGSGSMKGVFPVSLGDNPVGRPLLWNPDNTGSWRLAAADSGGSVCCWNISTVPDGWFTGLDMSGENCWWEENLPPLVQTGGQLQSGSFYVYPNPVQSGEGVIRFHPESDCTYAIRIFNMGGDLVTFIEGEAPGGSAWEVPWDTGDLAPGVYFVNLSISGADGTSNALFHAAVVH